MPSVVVVGASRGIGRELVRQYVADGWQVFATVRRPGDDLGDGVVELVADVTDEASLAAAAAALPELDVVVLNAGINVREGALADVAAERWA